MERSKFYDNGWRTAKDSSGLQKELNELQFQLFRMRENMKDISKDSRVLGIDQSKDDEWMIVHSIDDGRTCKIMLSDCQSPYRGRCDFSLVASYKEENARSISGILKGRQATVMVPSAWNI